MGWFYGMLIQVVLSNDEFIHFFFQTLKKFQVSKDLNN